MNTATNIRQVAPVRSACERFMKARPEPYDEVYSIPSKLIDYNCVNPVFEHNEP